MEKVFFDGWPDLVRTLIVAVLAYVVLVAFLRVSGKRTLAKLNAFDLVVTVALGSTLATMLLTKEVALAEGALALGLLIGLQFVVTWSSVRVSWVRRAVRSEPSLLMHRGRMLHHSMRGQRVTESEMLAAVRSAGVATLAGVEAVVLETDGSLSVVPRPDEGEATSLQDVSGADRAKPTP